MTQWPPAHGYRWAQFRDAQCMSSSRHKHLLKRSYSSGPRKHKLGAMRPRERNGRIHTLEIKPFKFKDSFPKLDIWVRRTGDSHALSVMQSRINTALTLRKRRACLLKGRYYRKSGERKLILMDPRNLWSESPVTKVTIGGASRLSRPSTEITAKRVK
ncbi:hypothetical protein ARMSODRAFT_682743 [Armillaria solidipes]|uniref:Uncharacterized protein n=1 Tax=Armillaria solidipes TaxID=1076256 RepID=A0A2H3ATN1_9AGAR|nr:hypothetical protein ARMSODRAFT_682743 [Armillaria solidipes]